MFNVPVKFSLETKRPRNDEASTGKNKQGKFKSHDDDESVWQSWFRHLHSDAGIEGEKKQTKDLQFMYDWFKSFGQKGNSRKPPSRPESEPLYAESTFKNLKSEASNIMKANNIVSEFGGRTYKGDNLDFEIIRGAHVSVYRDRSYFSRLSGASEETLFIHPFARQNHELPKMDHKVVDDENGEQTILVDNHDFEQYEGR